MVDCVWGFWAIIAIIEVGIGMAIGSYFKK